MKDVIVKRLFNKVGFDDTNIEYIGDGGHRLSVPNVRNIVIGNRALVALYNTLNEYIYEYEIEES